LVAQYLEESGERDAVILAEHWERSGEHQRAIGWYRRAAWQALEGNDLEAVLRHSQRAVACGAVGEELGEVQAAQAEAYMWRGAYREAVGLGRLAMLELPPRSPRWFQVAGAVAIAAGRTSDSTQLGQLADRLQAVAGQGESSAGFLISALRTALQIYIAADYPRAASLVAACQPLLADPAAHPPAVEASIYMMQANLAAADWRLDVCPRLYEKSAALFEQIGDLRNACAQRLDAALFYTDIGEFSHSEQLARQIIVDSERLGIGRLLPVACGALAVTLFLQLRGDEAMVAGKRSIELAEAAGDQRISGIGRVLLGRYKLEQGDLAGAEQDLLIALAALSQLPRFRARAQAIYARILIAQGRAAEGLRSAGQGYAVLQALGRVGTDEGLIRLAYVEALDQFRGPFADPAADQATALEVLRQGRERLLAQAAQIADPVAQRRFLELVDNASFLRCCAQRLGPIASPTADPAPPD
jgi:tetratricopeptide (TPR) repeat protein